MSDLIPENSWEIIVEGHITDLFDIVPNQTDADQDWLSSNGKEEIANGKGVPARGTRVNKYGEPK